MSLEKWKILTPLQKLQRMWEIWANYLMPKALKRCPKWKKSPNLVTLGGSPGLVVMGGDSCTEGCGFESQHCILAGHFFTLICCKIVLMFVWKRPKKRKRGRDGPFLKKVGSCKLPSIFCFFTTYPTRASLSWFRNRKKIIYSSISEIETKPIVTQKQILALAEPINAVQLYFPWMIQTKHCS